MPNIDMSITLATLMGAAVLLVSNRVRGDLVAMLVVFTMLVTGVLDVNESFSGFSSPVVIIIACMFIISEAIVHTGIAQRIGEAVLKHGGSSEGRLLVLIMAAASFLGSFMSSTATAAIFIPITMAVARKADINHKRLLIPLAVASLISGMMTLVATTPNIVVNNALRERELTPLSFFSFTPYGLVVFILAVSFMLFWGRDLLSKRRNAIKQKQERSIEDLMERYDVRKSISVLRVTHTSDLIDRSVARIQLGARYQINLIALRTASERGGEVLPARPESVFYADDFLVVIGSREKIADFVADYALEVVEVAIDPEVRREFTQVIGVGEVMLTPDSNLIGKSVREIRFHNQFQCLVLAIRREGTTQTTDFSDLPLKFGDVLLICGAWEDILRLREYRDQYLLLTLPQDYQEVIADRNRAPLVIGILITMIGLMVFNVLPTVTAVLGATAALVLTRCVKIDTCCKVIDWQTVILIAGILPLALALQKTGIIAQISQYLLTLFGTSSPLLVLGVLFLISAVIGLFLSNTPTAVLMAPMAIDIGLALNISPQACAMTVAIACSAAFVSPLGSPVNMIVREPGGYQFADYAKVGIPLLLLSLVTTVLLSWLLYLR